MLEKQQKRNKECMQFFYQVGFILILYGEREEDF
jgi:predicted nucleic acid-binding Zn ribbon protein